MSNDENKKNIEPHLKLGSGLSDAFDSNLAKLNLGSSIASLHADKLFGVSPKLSGIGSTFKDAFSPAVLEGLAKQFESDSASKEAVAKQLGLGYIDPAKVFGTVDMAGTANLIGEKHKRDIEKLKSSNEVLQAENANLDEENQKLIEHLATFKEQITIYEAKDGQIESVITRLKESGKLSEDELRELNASEDELDRLKRAQDLAIEEEKDTISEAIFQITDSMKSLKTSMILYISLLIGSGVIAILLICSLLWSVFFGAPVEVSTINGLMANYLALASPSVLKIVLLVIVLRFINNILKLRENLLAETGYIEKVSGVLKAGMLMSDYSRSMIEAREIFKKVINQLIKKDGSLDKDKAKDDDDAMAMSIAEKTVSYLAKGIK